MGKTASLANIGSIADSSLGFRNRIINGAMVIAQRGTTAVTSGYAVDRWRPDSTGQASFSYQQNGGGVTPPAGFTNYLACTSTAAYTPATNTVVGMTQGIEGYNTADFAWGTANAQTVTLSFWVRSSLAGTHSGSVTNNAANRSYVFSFTISATNTWEYKTVVIAGDTTGTWTTDNSAGVYLRFNLGVGTGTYGTTTTGWQAGNIVGLSNAVQVSATNGATFYITGVQLEKGSTATSFDYRPYGTELALCQRYYYKLKATVAFSDFGSGYATTTATATIFIPFPVVMRTAPTALEQSGTPGDYQILFKATAGTCTAGPTFGTGDVFGGRFQATTGSALTAGEGAMLRNNNSLSAYLAWSAEL
jgi:hypothetical protein